MGSDGLPGAQGNADGVDTCRPLASLRRGDGEVQCEVDQQPGAEAGGPLAPPGPRAVGPGGAGDVDVGPGEIADELGHEQRRGDLTGVHTAQVGDVGDVGVDPAR